MKGIYDLPYWVHDHILLPLKTNPLLVYFALEETSAGFFTCYHRSSTEAKVAQSHREKQWRFRRQKHLPDVRLGHAARFDPEKQWIMWFLLQSCSGNLLLLVFFFKFPLPWQPAFHRLQHGNGGYTEISQLEFLRPLTLQYSLIGPSLFMATSLIWLLLNRIFPGSTDADVSKGKCIILYIVGSICQVIETVKTLRGKKSRIMRIFIETLVQFKRSTTHVWTLFPLKSSSVFLALLAIIGLVFHH